MQVLIVPEKFNKNSPGVRARGTPAETGSWLIQYMCERLGVPNLAELDVLDFGCGCRFADAIVNKQLSIRSYTGIDVHREMIEFLSQHVDDPRMRFYYWNTRNPHYNPAGDPLTPESVLPSDPQTFDLICMFSVITHQLPQDAEMLFRLLRRRVRVSGRMFFSANIQEMDVDYREMVPEKPAAFSAYSQCFLQQLVERAGWRILSCEGKDHHDMPIQDSMLCAPV
jgi:2-polyprenyl-3-methyl-5-hydroxy-6-metoxy-1,4-benzoquinol methylase